MPPDLFSELIYDLIIKCILKPYPDKPYFGQFDIVPTPNLKEYNILLGKITYQSMNCYCTQKFR